MTVSVKEGLGKQQNLVTALILGFSGLAIVSSAAIVGGKFSGNFRVSLVGYCLLSGGTIGGVGAIAMNRQISQRWQHERDIDAQSHAAYSRGLVEGQERERGEFPQLLQGYMVKWEQEREEIAASYKNQLNSLKNAHDEALIAAIDTTTEEWKKEVLEREERIKTLSHTISELTEKEQVISERERAITQKQQDLQHIVDSINQDKLTLARQEGYRESLANSLLQKDRTIDELSEEIKQLQSRALEEIDIAKQTYYQLGEDNATETYENQIGKLQLANQKLVLKLKELEAYKEMDRVLPTLRDLILNDGKPLLKPVFLTGSQGSGKATHAIALMDIWREGSGVVPFCLDISEGGNEGSTWHRYGIPCTSKPRVMLEVLRALLTQLDPENDYFPFRNNREQYRKFPVHVFLIDEAMTALDALEKDEIEEIVSLLKVIETRGSKRKCFAVLMSIDSQIQNLSPKKVKLINTGRLSKYLQIRLNDSLVDVATSEELKSNLGLAKYLNVYGGSHFISALQSVDGKGSFFKAFKHATHHGHLLHETIPSSRIEDISLAHCPDWFPHEAKTIYNRYLEGEKTEDIVNSYSRPNHQPLNPDPSLKQGIEIHQPLSSLSHKSPQGEGIQTSANHQATTNQRPTSDTAIACSHCGSKDVIKNGKRNEKQRFVCNNCNKNFSVRYSVEK